MDALNKGLFAFASYNAGPTRIRSLRQEAAGRGLDPNLWFNNVELVAAERIGRETVTYVSNIYKYYIAYKLAQKQYTERKETKKQLKKSEEEAAAGKKPNLPAEHGFDEFFGNLYRLNADLAKNYHKDDNL